MQFDDFKALFDQWWASVGKPWKEANQPFTQWAED
jgi:hypothetical protein